MKINRYPLSFITGTAAILLANPSSLAATNKIEDFVLTPKQQGMELRLTTNNQEQENKDLGNVRFNTEMDNGFSDREPRM